MIYAFWKMVKEWPEVLIDRMMSGKISLAAWRRMTPMRKIDKPTKANLADLGYAGLFFNRTCFSGIVGAGPIGGMTQNSSYKIDCRFNKKELADAIRRCSGVLDRVEIVFGDGIVFLQKECLNMPMHSVVYIDPPYVTNGYKLYRYHFDKVEHERLADAVGDLRVPWLMSYDNHDLIRDLYVGEQAKFVKTYQSLKGSRFVKEILLLSDDFRLPSNDGPKVARSRRGRGALMDFEH
jgi:DNA adenine methylase